MNADTATEKAPHPSEYPQMFYDLQLYLSVLQDSRLQEVSVGQVIAGMCEDQEGGYEIKNFIDVNASYQRGRTITKRYMIRKSARVTCTYTINDDGTRNTIPDDATEGFLYHEAQEAGYFGTMQAYRRYYLMLKPHAKQIVN